ncbi:MAG: hypothetical protein ASARMPREDX12_004540 [Alectoria sarmentosa]|nr:MAG: hypothetical protein ASARMPREDX12_004540 [Alectoria sarmentosa]
MSEGKATSEKEFLGSVKRSIVEEMENLITMMKKCVADEFQIMRAHFDKELLSLRRGLLKVLERNPMNAVEQHMQNTRKNPLRYTPCSINAADFSKYYAEILVNAFYHFEVDVRVELFMSEDIFRRFDYDAGEKKQTAKSSWSLSGKKEVPPTWRSRLLSQKLS